MEPHPLKIAVLTCTYRRPHLLEYVMHCFEQQTYPAHLREMVILDDAGQLREAILPGIRIVSVAQRFPTLGAKRNRLVQLTDADAVTQWDDDDLFMPWALEAAADALRYADWSRPSLACGIAHRKRLTHIETFSRTERFDYAFQCGWVIRRSEFLRVGGYDERLSIGEDADLAQRLEAAGVTECDPIALGHQPAYIWGPWHNSHLSEPQWTYQTYDPDSTQRDVRVAPRRPPIDPTTLPIATPVVPRSWQHSWYTDRKC